MTIIQVSKITARVGELNQLPESLDTGEFGFATDRGQLFIGAPTYQPIAYRQPQGTNAGIFPYRNIRVLTELDLSKTITGEVYYHGPLVTTTLFPSRTRDVAYTWDVDAVDTVFSDYVIATNATQQNGTGRRIGELRLASTGATSLENPNGSAITDSSTTIGTVSITFNVDVVEQNGSKIMRLLYTNSTTTTYILQLNARAWKAQFIATT